MELMLQASANDKRLFLCGFNETNVILYSSANKFTVAIAPFTGPEASSEGTMINNSLCCMISVIDYLLVKTLMMIFELINHG